MGIEPGQGIWWIVGTGRHAAGLQKLRKSIKKWWGLCLCLAFYVLVVLGRWKWNWKQSLLWHWERRGVQGCMEELQGSKLVRGRCPCPGQGVGARWSSNFLLISKHSKILWFSVHECKPGRKPAHGGGSAAQCLCCCFAPRSFCNLFKQASKPFWEVGTRAD